MTAPVLTSLLPTVARHLPPDRHATGVLTTPTGAHLPVVCEHIEREHDGVAFVSRVPYYVAYAEGEPTQHESPAAFQALVRAGRAWFVDGEPEAGGSALGGVYVLVVPTPLAGVLS